MGSWKRQKGQLNGNFSAEPLLALSQSFTTHCFMKQAGEEAMPHAWEVNQCVGCLMLQTPRCRDKKDCMHKYLLSNINFCP